jgi:hypothetical protein
VSHQLTLLRAEYRAILAAAFVFGAAVLLST